MKKMNSKRKNAMDNLKIYIMKHSEKKEEEK